MDAASFNLGKDIDNAFKIPFQYYSPIYTSEFKAVRGTFQTKMLRLIHSLNFL